MMTEIQPVLKVTGLKLEADTSEGLVEIVKNVDLLVRPGEIVGIVGE